MPDAQETASVRFRPGDRVRVDRRVPNGHCRTPYYLRGKTGVVEHACGVFRDPEALAYYQPAAGVPLYIVRFRQADVWPGYAGPAGDTILADIYDHWLEPAEGTPHVAA